MLLRAREGGIVDGQRSLVVDCPTPSKGQPYRWWKGETSIDCHPIERQVGQIVDGSTVCWIDDREAGETSYNKDAIVRGNNSLFTFETWWWSLSLLTW